MTRFDDPTERHRGTDVAICARGKAGLDEAVTALQGLGRRAVGIPADASRPEGAEEFVRVTLDAWFGRMVETTDEEWAAALEINLMSGSSTSRPSGPTPPSSA